MSLVAYKAMKAGENSKIQALQSKSAELETEAVKLSGKTQTGRDRQVHHVRDPSCAQKISAVAQSCERPSVSGSYGRDQLRLIRVYPRSALYSDPGSAGAHSYRFFLLP
jgi:hypothetical protein